MYTEFHGVDSYGRFAPEFRIRTARDLRESLFAFSAKLRVNSMKLRVHLIALPPRRTGGGRGDLAVLRANAAKLEA